jgi:protein-tyrosine phosphatase
MASAIMQNLLAPEKRDKFIISSAGLYALEGQDMSSLAKTALREIDIEPPEHISTQLTNELAEDADLLLAMTGQQKDFLPAQYPGAMNKTYLLSQYAHGKNMFVPEDIEDPFGMDLDAYRKARDQIRSYVSTIVANSS